MDNDRTREERLWEWLEEKVEEMREEDRRDSVDKVVK